MDGDPALYDDALTYPFRGDRTGRRFVVGLSPFAVTWFLIMVVHALLSGSRRHPEHPGIPLEAVAAAPVPEEPP